MTEGHSTLTVVLVVGVSLAALFWLRTFDNGQSFVAERWREGSIRERGRMVEDLQNNKRLQGLSRADVLALLGEPDEEFCYTVDIGDRFCSEPWTYRFIVYFNDWDRVYKAELLD